jgi:two-component system, NarL family, nitrate/nitrite response regulator NarL
MRGEAGRHRQTSKNAATMPPFLSGLVLRDGVTITLSVTLTLQGSPAHLTPREREVLALVADGISNKAIARQLQVSPNTVKFHIAAILDKLDVATRADAVVAAVRRGEISP